MATSIKGLTVEINGDTTKLGKALEDVDAKSKALSEELGQINQALKFNPGNAELLAQKQKVLADAIAATRDRLNTLKQAEAQVQKQFERGEASEEQVRALQRAIISTAGKLDRYEAAAKKTADEVENLGKNAEASGSDVKEAGKKSEDTAKQIDKLGKSADKAGKAGSGMGRILAKGVGAVAAAAGAALAGLIGAAESTREYRIELNQLNAAFEQVGLSSEETYRAYNYFGSVLGDTRKAQETMLLLSKLTNTEQGLADWTDTLTGVYATYGEALPLEALTKAVNETADLGKLQGSLTDALEWGGVNASEFNAQLAALNTKEERAALIQSTLNGLYKEAGDRYNELNKDILDASTASTNLQNAIAQIGGTVEPIITVFKQFGADLLTEILPSVTSLSEAFRGLLDGTEGAAEDIGTALSDLLTQLLDRVVDIAPTIVSVAVDLITTLVTALLDRVPMLVSTVIQIVSMVLKGLADALPQIVDAITNLIPALVDALIDGIPLLLDAAIQLLMAIVDAIPVIIERLIPEIPRIIQAIQHACTQNMPVILRAAVQMFMGIVKAIPQIVRELVKALPELIKTIVQGLGEGFGAIAQIGRDLIRGLWQGISDMAAWIKDKIKGFGESVLNGIKDFFGIHSPSRKMAWIGEMLDEGLAKGIEDAADAPLDAMDDMTASLLDRDLTPEIDGLNLDRNIASTFAPVGTGAPDSALLERLDAILGAIEAGQVITLDGKALVGSTARDYDSALGQRRALAARGAI